MKKCLIASLCLMLPIAFFACGGSDSKSGDSDFPDLHPEDYPAVDTASAEYSASTQVEDIAGDVYLLAFPETTSDSVLRVVKRVKSDLLAAGALKRTTGQNESIPLEYTGKGVTVTGSYSWVGSGSTEDEGSYTVKMRIVFTDYKYTDSFDDFTYNGTITYLDKGTWSNAISLESTDCYSADLTVDISGVNHTITFDDVCTTSVVNGSGTYTSKTVYNIDGTKYVHTVTGKATIDDDEEETE